MDKKYYMILNVVLLVIIAITFYFQVKYFAQPGIVQWLPLVILGIVLLLSFISKRKMNKEEWYIAQQKAIQKSKEEKSKEGEA
jgi:protein-S-isoprenylcysteine O-methyltransferase Ste14